MRFFIIVVSVWIFSQTSRAASECSLLFSGFVSEDGNLVHVDFKSAARDAKNGTFKSDTPLAEVRELRQRKGKASVSSEVRQNNEAVETYISMLDNFIFFLRTSSVSELTQNDVYMLRNDLNEFNKIYNLVVESKAQVSADVADRFQTKMRETQLVMRATSFWKSLVARGYDIEFDPRTDWKKLKKQLPDDVRDDIADLDFVLKYRTLGLRNLEVDYAGLIFAARDLKAILEEVDDNLLDTMEKLTSIRGRIDVKLDDLELVLRLMPSIEAKYLNDQDLIEFVNTMKRSPFPASRRMANSIEERLEQLKIIVHFFRHNGRLSRAK